MRAVLSLLILLSIGGQHEALSQYRVLVSGRAVDQAGAPLSNVWATLFSPPCPGCMDNVVPSNRSLSDGAFFVDSTGALPDRFTLYLGETVPVGFWSPLGGPPYYGLAHLPEFRGMHIRPSRMSSQIDVGDVEVKIRFGKIIVKVPEKWKEITPESTLLVLRLHDRTGALIYKGKLPLATATARSDSVKLALTPGRWKVQLVLRHNNREFRSSTKAVNVQIGSCVVLPLEKRGTAQACGPLN